MATAFALLASAGAASGAMTMPTIARIESIRQRRDQGVTKQAFHRPRPKGMLRRTHLR
jgi:hypothetical protein